MILNLASWRTIAQSRAVITLSFLGLVGWIAHFLRFQSFGLYEDDYDFIASAMEQEPGYLVRQLDYFRTWPQGRPVGFYLASVLGFIGDHLGGLTATYILGFLIVTLNSFLFYLLLKRVGNHSTALLGALAFLLFPADTTKILLTHAFILQTSLTFLLVASLCYLCDRKMLAYVLICGSLLSYESAFIVFLGIPLLKRHWNTRWIQEMGFHSCILSSLAIVALGIRLLTQESRVASVTADPLLVVQRVLHSIVIGPLTTTKLFLTAPLTLLSNGSVSIFLVFFLSLAIYGWVLRKLAVRPSLPIELTPWPIPFTTRHLLRFICQLWQMPWFQFLVIGAILLGLGYVTAFTHYPPTAEFGRATSVHLAATVGGAICFAALASGLLQIAAQIRVEAYGIALITLYLSCLMAYHSIIQTNFQQSWQNQRNLWTDIVQNCPDITDDTIIFISNQNLPQTKYIKTNSWADGIIFQQIYQFPKDWKYQPKAYIVRNQWQNGARSLPSGGFGITTITWPGFVEVRPETHLIFLRNLNGRFQRIEGLFKLRSKQTFLLKPRQLSTVDQFSKGVLFKYLIKPKDS